jgi:16S rRNA (guanine(966)-N(2))-methyltransferase RsmD
MRIIAGEYRGRRLLPPESDNTTRPITDRVKQSLFDVITPLLDGARVYDCFAGTGSMGLESLSRGASDATFFEADRSALTRLRKNIETLGVGGRSVTVGGDLFKWFSVHETSTPARSIDLIFLDPPYRFLREKGPELQALAQRMAAHLKPDGTIVFRHDAADALPLPTLSRYDERIYGGMALEFLKPAGDHPAAADSGTKS